MHNLEFDKEKSWYLERLYSCNVHLQIVAKQNVVMNGEGIATGMTQPLFPSPINGSSWTVLLSTISLISPIIILPWTVAHIDCAREGSKNCLSTRGLYLLQQLGDLNWHTLALKSQACITYLGHCCFDILGILVPPPPLLRGRFRTARAQRQLLR